EHDVARGESGLLGGTVPIDAYDLHASGAVRGAQSEPGPAAHERASGLLHLREDRFQQVHRHEHVARDLAIVTERVADEQAADAQELAALVEEGRAAVVVHRWA